MANIHPAAIVDPAAVIGPDVSIGPLCVIEGDVVVGEGCQLASHVVIKSGTTLGKRNTVCEGAVLGGRPQHLQAGDRVGRLLVGDGNTLRENATVHCGLRQDEQTVVGDNNLIMVNAHIGHDCCLGDNTIIANNAMIAGHVAIESRAYISGAVGVHQFCRVGQLAMVGGQAHINRDVPPFVTVDGVSSHVVGLNSIGLRRNGFSDQDVLQLKAAYRTIYRSGLSWRETLETLKEEFASGPAVAFYDFMCQGKRGFVQERQSPTKSTLKLFPTDKSGDATARVRNAS